MVESGALFQVADGEFDHSVVTVELVDIHGRGVEVGEERVVPPVGPHLTTIV